MRAIVVSLLVLPLFGACARPAPASTDGSSVVLPAAKGSAGAPTRPLVTAAEPVTTPPPLVTDEKAPGDGCRALAGWKGDVPHRRQGAPTPVAGQMTEEAAVAKRLFDSEKWPEAANALGRVAAGETHDDEGNRAIADYLRAIALYHTKKPAEAAARFRVFSHNPSHPKFAESLLWIVRLATVSPTPIKLDDVALYTPEELARYDNPQQRDVYGKATYMLGHQRYDEGNLSEAKLLLEAAKRVGPWSREAEVCLSKIAASSPR